MALFVAEGGLGSYEADWLAARLPSSLDANLPRIWVDVEEGLRRAALVRACQ
jgi:hypothetical protein